MVARDEAHNAVRGSVGLRETRTAAGVVQIARERRIAAREASPHARGETREQHSRDAMPELGVRGLRAVVKEASDDDLVVGAQGTTGAQHTLGRVANAVSHHAPCDVLIVVPTS